MSQSFKLKYDQMRESDPTKEGHEQQPELPKAYDAFYPEDSQVRNLAFVWPDGRRLFLNYGYLIHVEYTVPEHTILMTFTSHVVTLAGVNLVGLFYDLMQRLPRQIICTDKRYNIIGEGEKAIVNTIAATVVDT